jgi:glyoxylase-like metal-dependent hydrolase (beta-lactamase superfamily II)
VISVEHEEFLRKKSRARWPALRKSEGVQIGEVQLSVVSDGTFVARPAYFGADVEPERRPDVFPHGGAAWLPIGCFVVRAPGRTILVDAGLGPDMQRLPDDMHLVGGQLPTGLRAAGVARDEITDVVCTHLHADHVGWLFDEESEPVFPAATIWFGAADARHFVDGPGEMAEHIARGFRRCAGTAALRPLDQDTAIVPGVQVIMAPGHTPGHLCLALGSTTERVLLLGDAITCPVQLEEPTWHSMGDVDPELADRTRARLWRELADGRTSGVGAHFPELRFGRVSSLAERRWSDLP